MGARAGCSANAASLGRISRCVRRCGKLLQGHLVGSLLPIPEVEGKEGSRYPRHRWTFSFSVMCYFQIRRRTLLTGYFKAQERKKQDCNALPRTLFSALSAYSAIVNGNLGNCRTLSCSVKAQLPRGSWRMVHPARSPAATLLAIDVARACPPSRHPRHTRALTTHT